VSFQAESVSFQAESVSFQAESVTFQAESVTFQAESVTFQAESVSFQAERLIVRRLKEGKCFVASGRWSPVEARSPCLAGDEGQVPPPATRLPPGPFLGLS
jgi:hypothetical protein